MVNIVAVAVDNVAAVAVVNAATVADICASVVAVIKVAAVALMTYRISVVFDVTDAEIPHFEDVLDSDL